MKKIIFALLFLVASLSAYEVQKTTVKFTAFKTYAKKGVSGVFNKVAVDSKTQKSIEALLENTTAVIDTSSVNSGNKGRDAKLVGKFFNVQNVSKIKATLSNVSKNSLIAKITMHEKTLNIPMSYTVKGNTIQAKGVIDLADFGMLDSLHSLNKA